VPGPDPPTTDAGNLDRATPTSPVVAAYDATIVMRIVMPVTVVNPVTASVKLIVTAFVIEPVDGVPDITAPLRVIPAGRVPPIIGHE